MSLQLGPLFDDKSSHVNIFKHLYIDYRQIFLQKKDSKLYTLSSALMSSSSILLIANLIESSLWLATIIPTLQIDIKIDNRQKILYSKKYQLNKDYNSFKQRSTNQINNRKLFVSLGNVRCVKWGSPAGLGRMKLSHRDQVSFQVLENVYKNTFITSIFFTFLVAIL